MPSSTSPPWSIPYPLGTDPVADGDDAIKNVADRQHLLLNQNLLRGATQGATVALNSGWTGNWLADFRCGWGYVYGVINKAAWGSGDVVGTVPVGYRPALTSYVLALGRDFPDQSYPLSVNASNGFITIYKASPGSNIPNGLLLSHAYPVWT